MRILITGAAGFIGSHLFERLAREQYRVIGYVRSGGNDTAERLRKLDFLNNVTRTHPNASLIIGPTLGEVSRAIAEFSPTVCVHLAGRSSVRESLQNPGLYAAANGATTIELLEILRRCACKRFIHSSSVMVYGKDAPLPYREATLGSSPASFYGASKLATEALVNTWRALHGMEAINLRLFSVYGPELRADCVPHLIASAIRDDREFTLFGDGSSIRDYVEIDDVMRALEAAIGATWSADFPLALNIGSGVGTSLIELVRKIEQGLNKKARIVQKPALSAELPAIVAGIELARITLGWKPSVSLSDGITRMTEWFARTQ